MNTSKFRIDVINRYFYPVAAGIETCLLETYPRLLKKGWKVTIHTSKNTLNQKNYLSKTDTVRNIRVKRYPLGKFGFLPQIDWSNTDIISLNNFDIFPHFQILVYCLFLKLLGKKRFALILSPHGGFTPEWSTFSKIQTFIKRGYHYTLGVILINLVVDKIQAVSKWEKKEIISKRVEPSLISVIENGVEDEAFMDVEKKASNLIKRQVKSYGKYIVQVGRIHPIKNYETVLQALTKQPNDINFVIIGPIQDQNYKKYLDQLIQELNLGKRVFFTGVVRGVDKFYVLKKAQMMVHMAIWENFCNVVHEGMSQGLVCIVGDNSGLALKIRNGENGFLVKTTNYDKLAKRIAFVLDLKNKTMLDKIKENNRKDILEHSWAAVVNKIDNLYREMKPAI